MYYHILVQLKNNKNKDNNIILCEYDITEYNIVKEDYVLPYLNNKTFYIGGAEVKKEILEFFKVSKTPELAETIYEKSKQRFGFQARLVIKKHNSVLTDDYEITRDVLKETKKDFYVNDNNKFNLHPMIAKVALKKLEDGHYADAVESSFKEINSRLKKLYMKYGHAEKDGKDLMAVIFKEDSPFLKVVENINTLSEKSEQEGYKFLFMGSMLAIRNPKAHANEKISEEEAFERLILASLLMKKVDLSIKFSELSE